MFMINAASALEIVRNGKCFSEAHTLVAKLFGKLLAGRMKVKERPKKI